MTVEELLKRLSYYPLNAKIVVCVTGDSEYGVCNDFKSYSADKYLRPNGINAGEIYVELRYVK